MKEKKQKKMNFNVVGGVVFLILLIYIFIHLLTLLAKPKNKYFINIGTILNKETHEAYIIRDEKIIENESKQQEILLIKGQGEKVSKQAPVFKYWEKEDKELKKQINEINDHIQEKLIDNEEVFSSNIKSLETQIEAKLDTIKNKNDMYEVLEIKKDINTAITKKAEEIIDVSAQDNQMKALLDQKKQVENEMDNKTTYAFSPISGTVSYRVDGYEGLLLPSEIENITKEGLEGIDIKTGQVIPTNNTKAKIVNNFEAYLAVVSSTEDSQKAKAGDEVRIVLSTKEEIKARVVSNNHEENIIVFKIGKKIEDLINYRKISIEIIWNEYSGLKIPKSSILYDQGNSYVIKTRAGQEDKVLVKVKKEDEKYCIIDNFTTQEKELLKEQLLEMQKDKKTTSIKIYDEILINPDLKKK